VSGAANGAERAKNRVERSGAWQKTMERERSAEREVAEREQSGERELAYRNKTAFLPFTLRSHALPLNRSHYNSLLI